MKRFWLILLFSLPVIISAQLRYDVGWERRTSPGEGIVQRLVKSVTVGPDDSIWAVSEVTPSSGGKFLEIKRYEFDGDEIGTPIAVAVTNAVRDCVNPTIVPTGQLSSDHRMTLIYEQLNVADSTRALACAIIDGNTGAVLSNEAVAPVYGIAKVKAFDYEGAVYVLATQPYYQTFTNITLFRFVGSTFTTPVMGTRQAPETAVDFDFDASTNVYIGTNVTGFYNFPFGRVTKWNRTSTGPWTYGWSLDLRVSSTSALQFNSIAYDSLHNRMAAGCAFTQSPADSRPALLFLNLVDGSPSWWYWNAPADATNVDMGFMNIQGRSIRLAGRAWSVEWGTLDRWFYMDIDSESIFSWWWYSAAGEGARTKALTKVVTGETIAGFADSGGNSTRWLTGKPIPQVSFDPIGPSEESGMVTALYPLPSGDMIAGGQLGSGDAVSRIYMPARPIFDAYDQLKAGRVNTVTRSVLINDENNEGAIAVQEGTVGQTTQGHPVTLNSDGTFTYTAPLSPEGRDTFYYRAHRPTLHGYVQSEPVEVRLYVARNHNPVANIDSAWTYQDKGKVIDVLANDSDADGDPLSVISTTQPSNGKVILDAGLVRYKPNLGFVGYDQFQYTITDDLGNTASSTVTVQVKLVPVTLSSISPTLVNAGSPDLTLTLTGTSFNAGTRAFADDVELTITVGSSTSGSCIIPANMLEIEHLYSITVRNPNGAVSAARTLRVKGISSLQLVLVSFVREGSNLVANLEMRNSGTGTSAEQSVTGALLNAKVTTSTLPINLGKVPPRDSRPFSVAFTSLKSGTAAKLKIDITVNGSTRRYLFDVVAP